MDRHRLAATPANRFIILPAVTGDLDAIALLEESGALVDGELVCLLAAANGQQHVVRYLNSRGYGKSAQAASEPVLAASSRDLPTASILLANYNHARYLDTSLSGILCQVHPATEVIVVDDGSTDGSVDVIQRYASRHPNLRLMVNPENRGQHYSIQRALQAATGEYVVWASSDDLLLPRFLERSLEVLKAHPQAALCFSRLAVFVDGSKSTRTYLGETHGAAFEYGKEARYLSPAELKSILKHHYLWMSGNTVVVKRAILLENGGFEASLRWHADWFAYYTIALRHGACVIPDTLAMMRERSGTYSDSGMRNERAQREVLTSLFDLVKSREYGDLLEVFRSCPSIFSPLGGRAIARTSLRVPRHYDFAWRVVAWFGLRLARSMLWRLKP